MANEAKWTFASAATLESSGASAANAAFVQANDVTLSSTNHSNFTHGDFVLKTVGFSGGLSTTNTAYIGLYARDINAIDSSTDVVTPSSSSRNRFVGSFMLGQAGSSTTNYFSVTDVPLGGFNSEQEYYLENQSGVSLNSGWSLRVVPKAIVPGA